MPIKRKKKCPQHSNNSRSAKSSKSKSTRSGRKTGKNSASSVNISKEIYNELFPLLLPVPKVETLETSGECLIQQINDNQINDDVSVASDHINMIQTCCSNSTDPKMNFNEVFNPKNLLGEENPSHHLMPLKLRNEYHNYNETDYRTNDTEYSELPNNFYDSEMTHLYNLPKIPTSDSISKRKTLDRRNENLFLNFEDSLEVPVRLCDGYTNNKISEDSEQDDTSDDAESSTNNIPLL